MEEKEKAMQLISKFVSLGFTLWVSKQCALIAVDEILDNNKILFEDVLNDQYWKEVKKEIELL